MFFKRYFLTITLLPLLVLALSASYYRFVVLKDYMVTYEAECDPYTEQCFIYCEDEECEEIFYYKYLTRQASEIYLQCGSDITECEAATSCSEEIACEVTYCEDDPENCEDLDDIDQEADPEEFYNELEKIKETI